MTLRGYLACGGVMENRELENQVDRAAARLGEVQRAISEVIVGQDRLVESLLAALLLLRCLLKCSSNLRTELERSSLRDTA